MNQVKFDGEKFRKAVKNADYNLAQVARRAGLSDSYASNASMARRCNYASLAKMCDVINAKAEDFIIADDVVEDTTTPALKLETFTPEITRGDVHDLTLAILTLVDELKENTTQLRMTKKNLWRLIQDWEGDEFDEKQKGRREFYENHSNKKAKA